MKKVTVEYGGFSAEQEVEENLYNAIYQQGREDVISDIIDSLDTMHDMVGLDNRTLYLLIKSLRQIKEQHNE